jgi:hypothetical protein
MTKINLINSINLYGLARGAGDGRPAAACRARRRTAGDGLPGASGAGGGRLAGGERGAGGGEAEKEK